MVATMQNKLTMSIDAAKRAAFKSKTAAAGVTMSEVLNAAIDDYLSGKYKPVKRGVKKST